MGKPFDSMKYRRQNQKYGTLIRWWKPLPCECEGAPGCELCEGNSGLRYIEQTVPLSSYDGQPCRALTVSAQFEQEVADFGLMPAGSLQLSVLVDEMDFTHRSRVMLLDPQYRKTIAETVTRGAGEGDALSSEDVISISVVVRGGVFYEYGRDFQIGSDGKSVRWVNDPDAIRPAIGAKYSIEFAAFELWTILDTATEARGSSSDGGSLPREFTLTK